MSRVLVGLSGGVDSAVSAYLLMQQGFDVTAGFMINYTTDDDTCTTKQDLQEAQKVADYLGIKLHTFDYQEEYNNRIVEYIVESYKNGLTPNPDILCNSEIKFKVFLEEGSALGFDYIATGHYAQIKKNHPTFGEITYEHSHYFDSEATREIAPSEQKSSIDKIFSKNTVNNQGQKQTLEVGQKTYPFYSLLKGIDSNKDQSYFLAGLHQYQLSKSLFPLGGLTKPQVRAIAKEVGLPNANRKDSQGICFIGKVSMRDFLQQYIPIQKGPIIDIEGNTLGEHNGVRGYTIGQRQGLGIAAAHPLFVVKKDITTNTLTVGYADTDELYASEIQVSNRHRLGETYPLPRIGHAKIRYRQADQKVILHEMGNNTILASFSQPQRAVASGQILVAYDGEKVIGSGVII